MTNIKWTGVRNNDAQATLMFLLQEDLKACNITPEKGELSLRNLWNSCPSLNKLLENSKDSDAGRNIYREVIEREIDCEVIENMVPLVVDKTPTSNKKIVIEEPVDDKLRRILLVEMRHSIQKEMDGLSTEKQYIAQGKIAILNDWLKEFAIPRRQFATP